MSLAASDMGRSAWAEHGFERLSPVLGGLLLHCGGRPASPLLFDVVAAETLSSLGPPPVG